MMEKVKQGNLVKWLISVGMPLLLFFVPTSEVFTSQARMFLVLSVMAILVIAFGLMDMMIPALLLPAGYWVFGVVEKATEA